MTEQYYAKKILDFHPLPEWKFVAYHGWQEQGDGKLFYGIPVMNGRLKGEAKTALRTVIERCAPNIGCRVQGSGFRV